MRGRVPKLCHHKAQQLGFVKLAGNFHYFEGRWPRAQKTPPAAVQDQYDRLIGRLLQDRADRKPAVSRRPTVAEIWLAYKEHCKAYYRKDGKVTTEVNAIDQACRVVAALCPDLPADEFDTIRLKAVRQAMVEKGWCRSNVNDQVTRVRCMFKWAAAEWKLIPMTTYTDLKELMPLKKGRTTAPEGKKVRPVPWALVEQTLPHLAGPVRSMVQVHYHLGCRSEDVVIMRPCDLDCSGDVWLYTPASWKTEHLDEDEGDRLVYWVGPRAQALLAPLLSRERGEEGWVFPARGERGRYSTNSYRRAVTRACDLHGIQRWFPLQLRHARLTDVRKVYRAEGAQAVARHRLLSTTEIYAERSSELARKIAAETG